MSVFLVPHTQGAGTGTTVVTRSSGTRPEQEPSMTLSRQDLVNLCEIYKAKALEEHDQFRAWQTRAIEAETRLSIYEPGDPPGDARAWMNRALLAEAQLATLRTAYEPASNATNQEK